MWELLEANRSATVDKIHPRSCYSVATVLPVITKAKVVMEVAVSKIRLKQTSFTVNETAQCIASLTS